MKHNIHNFDQDVIQQSFQQPVVADFWAPWCGPCRMLGPVLDQLASKANGQWKLAKINVDEFQREAASHQVRSIPSVKLFHEGKIIGEFTGALPEKEVEAFLARHLPVNAS